jgi:hypothetical protein
MLGKAFTFAIALATTGAGPQAAPDRAAFDSDEAAARAESGRAEIAAVLAGARDQGWAGSYYWGDGLGANVSLDLAPGAGFVFEWHGCLGLYARNYGTASESAGHVLLEPELANDADAMGIDLDLVPVTWGPRRYLIPRARTGAFCNAVNRGSEPRKTVHGGFLLRRGDENTTAFGRPRTAEGELDCLLDHPIRATIVSVGLRQVKKDDPQWVTVPVVLDAGREHGVWTGMEFHRLGPGTYAVARVTRVFERSSEAVIGVYGEKDFRPRRGWSFATSLE